MQAIVLKESNEKVVLHLKKCRTNLANAVRRCAIRELPAFAITEVTFFENNSPMYNEYVAHRIGLVPLTFAETAADAQFSFTLEAEALDSPLVVRSGELKSGDEEVSAFNKEIPLIKLGKGQRIRLEGSARLGKPREHARFQSCHASYSLYPEAIIEKGGKEDELEVCEKCLLNLEQDDEPIPIEETQLCDECKEKAKKGNFLIVKVKEGELVFRAESYNNASAREHLQRATAILIDKLGELKELGE